MAKYSFNVYIDESGDEGFKMKDSEWVSSKWFVIGAFITHSRSDLPLSRCVDEIKARFNWENHKPLHFLTFSHEKKKFIINCLTNNPGFKLCYVAFNKQKVGDGSSLRNKRYLYNYCTRFLLERVSWLVNDLGGEAHLIFENRANTSYDELNQYITDLIGKDGVQIRPNVFKSWKAIGKGQLKNLQLADAITTSLFKALEKNQFGLTEQSYIEALKPFIYNRKGNYHGYGIKMFPEPLNSPLLLSEYDWLNQFTKRNIVV
jgi:hypothetical protein